MTPRRRAAAAPVAFLVNGDSVEGREGDTVASALMALGRAVFRAGPDGGGRGIFCGIGICYDCLVTVDGRPNRRGCMVRLRPGMRVELTLP